MKEIIFYKKANGDVPMEEFLNKLEKDNPNLYAKVWLKIRLLVIDSLGYGEVKHIGDKIYEIRIKQSSNISRVFYFTSINNNIVLLDGILKKTQKLDRKTIAKIKKYKDDFLTQ